MSCHVSLFSQKTCMKLLSDMSLHHTVTCVTGHQLITGILKLMWWINLSLCFMGWESFVCRSYLDIDNVVCKPHNIINFKIS